MEHKQKSILGAALLVSAGAVAAMLASDPGAPTVDVQGVNPGSTVERRLCLTVAVPGGASECGDLRLAHSLPSVRTLNQVRTPVLVYNSQHASPNPVVAANVSLPGGSSGLSRVVATLSVNGNPRAQGVWRGSTWPTGAGPVRIAVSYDAAGDHTGPYRYSLEVKACYGASCTATVATGQLAVVNRRDSPFGAGWWMAGVERLVMDPFGNPVLWVGGDGSTRRYTAARGDSVWGVQSLAAPDTLKREGNGWVRLVAGGGRVRFDAVGQHVATSNALGHTTEFWYGAEGRLDSIGVPPTVAGTGDLVYPVPRRLIRPYAFVYASDGRLASVDAPGKGLSRRRTTVYRSGARVDSIADPDDTRVRFGYTDGSRLHIASRTDRRGYRTDYRYDSSNRLASSKLWVATVGAGDSVVTRLRPVQSLGVASAEGGGAVSLQDAYAAIDGPRTDVADVTRLWVDRWGAPQRIVNALGDTIELLRGDPRYPALVTRAQYPNGRVVGAEYDAHGNLAASTDSSTSRTESDGTIRYATTRYEWDPKWHAVTKITRPEGEVTRLGYDPVSGNRVWQQVGDDVTRRVAFRFVEEGTAKGLIRASTAPGSQRSDSVAYDVLGNLSLVVGPSGARVEYRRDALGRDSVFEAPLEGALIQRRTVAYQPGSDRVERLAMSGPAMSGAVAQTLWVHKEYDAEGNVTAVDRWSDPDLASSAIGKIRTAWRYDGAGRRIVEVAPGSGTFTDTWTETVCTGETLDSCTEVPHDSTYTVEYKDSTVYNAAGNPVELHTRRTNPGTQARLVIRMKYDEIGQMTERVVPQVHYRWARDQGIPRNYRTTSTASCTGSFLERTYPSRPNDGACGYRIDEDIQTFRYDRVGNLILADNRDAQVRRQFNRNGTLRVDSLRIQTVDHANFSVHQYGLEFEYDLNGRRTQLRHPAQLAASPSQNTVRYGYDSVTGMLDEVTDPLGNVFRYEVDERGALRKVRFIDAGYDEFDYSDDGALTGHRTYRHTGTGDAVEALRQTEFKRDTQGRLTRSGNTVGLRDTVTSKYSGMDQVVGTASVLYGDATTDATFRGKETFNYDALGNPGGGSGGQSVKRYGGRDATDFTHTSGYEARTDRLAWTDRSTVLPEKDGQRETVNLRDVLAYDEGGNLGFATQSYRSTGSCSSQAKKNADCEDRAAFYGADGRMRAAEHRVRMGEDNNHYWRNAFEEYRYDALGRRVWVRSRVVCPIGMPSTWPLVPCYSAIRRTVWDGDVELWEIQMPGADDSQYLENDTQALPVQAYIDWYPLDQNSMAKWNMSAYSRFDPNPRHGRIAYTHGLGADQPLSVLRVGLNRYYPATYPETGGQGVSFAPFASMPLTDWRGQVDGTLHPGGGKQHCQTFSGTTRCTTIVIPRGWSAYGQEDPSLLEWHGTLLTGKQDATGTLYRRARYLDPRSGRFTQEDPTGLAGGVNLYGFAGGDPINFADPSGLFRLPRLPRTIPLWTFAITLGAAGGSSMSFGQALWGTTKAFGAMTIGSAAAAGLQSAVGKTSFEDAFYQNLGYSSLFLAGSAVAAHVVGGEVASVGANGLFQGYVESSEEIGSGGGLTIGTAAVVSDPLNTPYTTLGGLALGVHERGHTVQFILLSATGKEPWLPYLALGAMGTLQKPYTEWWENFASWLGGLT